MTNCVRAFRYLLTPLREMSSHPNRIHSAFPSLRSIVLFLLHEWRFDTLWSGLRRQEEYLFLFLQWANEKLSALYFWLFLFLLKHLDNGRPWPPPMPSFLLFGYVLKLLILPLYFLPGQRDKFQG